MVRSLNLFHCQSTTSLVLIIFRCRHAFIIAAYSLSHLNLYSQALINKVLQLRILRATVIGNMALSVRRQHECTAIITVTVRSLINSVMLEQAVKLDVIAGLRSLLCNTLEKFWERTVHEFIEPHLSMH